MSAGIEVTLDQWDAEPGDDLPRFMQNGASKSDCVLVTCTPQYKAKVEAGIGGVGFEAMIVTGELVANVGSGKFVPVARSSADFNECVSVFLRTLLAVKLDFAGEPKDEWQRLLRKIHGVDPAKPPLGTSPFEARTDIGAEGSVARVLDGTGLPAPDQGALAGNQNDPRSPMQGGARSTADPEAVAQRVREFRSNKLSKLKAGEFPVPLEPGATMVLHVISAGAFDGAPAGDVWVEELDARHSRFGPLKQRPVPRH
jgi:hypothetical protein